jgi:GABA(A) receptor-associated protein
MKTFKESHTTEERLNEATKILTKYPLRIPIIVEKAEGCRLKDIQKNKYLAPREMPMCQFVFTVRKKIDLQPSEAIFLMVDGHLVQSSILLAEVYEKHKDEDGFLYMVYTSENTFG